MMHYIISYFCSGSLKFKLNNLIIIAMKTTIKALKQGEFFRLKDFDENEMVSESSVWIRGKFERSSKMYSCTKFDDFCHEQFFKGSKVVYVGFDF